MTMSSEVTRKEVEDLLAECARLRQLPGKGTRFPNMTYEQGIAVALHWAFGIPAEGDLDPSAHPLDQDTF